MKSPLGTGAVEHEASCETGPIVPSPTPLTHHPAASWCAALLSNRVMHVPR